MGSAPDSPTALFSGKLMEAVLLRAVGTHLSSSSPLHIYCTHSDTSVLRWMKSVALPPLHIISSEERLLPRLPHAHAPVSCCSYKSISFPCVQPRQLTVIKARTTKAITGLTPMSSPAESLPTVLKSSSLKGGLCLNYLIKEPLFLNPRSPRMSYITQLSFQLYTVGKDL